MRKGRSLLPIKSISNEDRAKECLRPRGIIDATWLMVLRERDRIGSISLSRRESAGAVTDRDLQVIGVLAPHLRRAATISDVLNMQTIKIGTFESAFDLVQAGVLFVDRDCKIIHANRAARAMLENRSPIQSVDGELTTQMAQTAVALKKAVAVVTEAAIGRMGIGIPVPQSDGGSAYIYVLPLMTGDTRSRLAPRASAAFFVTEKMAGLVRLPRPSRRYSIFLGPLGRSNTRGDCRWSRSRDANCAQPSCKYLCKNRYRAPIGHYSARSAIHLTRRNGRRYAVRA
jgi:hypothetical protein